MRALVAAVLCLAVWCGQAQARPVSHVAAKSLTAPAPDVHRPTRVELLRQKVKRLEAKLGRIREAREERRERRRCRAPKNIVVLGHCIEGRGYDVGEHPAFGGVAPVHHGPCHYAGRALDVNDGAGESAAEMASLDRLNAYLRTLPRAWVLWRTAGHYNHLHVAYDCVG